jgi:hypothetical protein
MEKRFGISEKACAMMASIFGISGVCNLLGAIKTAKFYQLGRKDLVVTICTDDIGRYHSVMEWLTEKHGRMDEAEATARTAGIFHRAGIDWIQEATVHNRNRWHNLKYYTWVEQQGKKVEELDAQKDPEWWAAHQEKVGEIDKLIAGSR